MELYYVHQLVEERVEKLIEEDREEEAIELIKAFSEAQDMVNKVIPFSFPEDEDLFVVLIIRMEARESLLYYFMEPYLEDALSAIAIPIYFN